MVTKRCKLCRIPVVTDTAFCDRAELLLFVDSVKTACTLPAGSEGLGPEATLSLHIHVVRFILIVAGTSCMCAHAVVAHTVQVTYLLAID